MSYWRVLLQATLLEKMLSAVLYCHRHGVVHRDIKVRASTLHASTHDAPLCRTDASSAQLDNFIYESAAEDAELKMIDFGFACKA